MLRLVCCHIGSARNLRWERGAFRIRCRHIGSACNFRTFAPVGQPLPGAMEHTMMCSCLFASTAVSPHYGITVWVHGVSFFFGMRGMCSRRPIYTAVKSHFYKGNGRSQGRSFLNGWIAHVHGSTKRPHLRTCQIRTRATQNQQCKNLSTSCEVGYELLHYNLRMGQNLRLIVASAFGIPTCLGGAVHTSPAYSKAGGCVYNRLRGSKRGVPQSNKSPTPRDVESKNGAR